MKDDTVSRAAVMESLTREYNRRRTGDGLKLAWIEKAVNDVPEVKTEIIRCKDCKWCEDADGLMCKNPASWVVATDRDFGCVLAERRTDGVDNVPM